MNNKLGNSIILLCGLPYRSLLLALLFGFPTDGPQFALNTLFKESKLVLFSDRGKNFKGDQFSNQLELCITDSCCHTLKYPTNFSKADIHVPCVLSSISTVFETAFSMHQCRAALLVSRAEYSKPLFFKCYSCLLSDWARTRAQENSMHETGPGDVSSQMM